MIYGVTAPTGGGKSYFALRKILKWLTERPARDCVVTNLALDVPVLCEWLVKEYGEMFGAAERIRLLNLDEIGCFWRYYGPGFELPGERVEVLMGDGKKAKQLDYSIRDQTQGSVLYVIDEADEIFSARHFASMVGDIRYYMRHQRKFSDDVYLLCPAWEFLVKEMRIMCHGVWVMENTAQMKMGTVPYVGGFFRGVGWIKATQWKVNQGGSWGGATAVPREQHRFRVDVAGLASCYRTEDGIGVKGFRDSVRKAEKAKGLHPAWLALPVILAVVGVAMAPRMIGMGLTSAVGATEKAVAIKPVEKPAAVQPVPVKTEEDSGVYFVGKAPGRSGELRIFLSDGREYHTQMREFQGFAPNAVKIDGKIYRTPPPGYGLH